MWDDMLDISSGNISEILFVESEAVWIELGWIICLCVRGSNVEDRDKNNFIRLPLAAN